MTAESLVVLLKLFEQTGLEVWLDGGWAVDAVLGEQTRPHKDMDIIVRLEDVAKLRDILGSRGFSVQQSGREFNFVLADGHGLEIDVHAIVFDSSGNGIYRMENGSDWIFPSSGFQGRGLVQGINVRCLTPETQVLCTLTAILPRKKTSRIWNCFKPIPALNYHLSCSAIEYANPSPAVPE